jgi:hypothetical protein
MLKKSEWNSKQVNKINWLQEFEVILGLKKDGHTVVG